jgi:hypothetical protein
METVCCVNYFTHWSIFSGVLYAPHYSFLINRDSEDGGTLNLAEHAGRGTTDADIHI